MSFTTNWAPNQGAVAQVETYTFSAPNGAGNTYVATLNGKSVMYSANSTDGLTAAAAATGLFNLLNTTSSIAAEFTEITFANPSSGVVTATAKVAGTPFANVPGTSAGLVLSTGNGLANGITTAHTTPNTSPSDVNDAQNWLRANLSTNPPALTRQLPQNGDDVVVANSTTPMLWNLDQLAAVQFNTFTRWQSMQAEVGLPDLNPNGYSEWRAKDFKFVGPQGSTPAGGLVMVLGQGSTGAGPGRERYDLGSQKFTLTALAGGSPEDEWGIRVKGIHTQNTFTALGGVSLAFAYYPGEVTTLLSGTVDGGATVGFGPGVTWTAGSTLTCYGGSVIIGAAPATLLGNNGTLIAFNADGLTWAAITVQGNCNLNWLCGGTITTLAMSVGCTLDKSNDPRALTITNSTIDGDSCLFNDPLNAITWTNATTVKQQVTSGPFNFTGTRTVKVT